MNSQYLTFNATVGGVFFSFLPYIDYAQLVQTVFLAAVGAVVSLGVTLIVRYLSDMVKGPKK
ncbi:MAG: hypothetical protein LBI72_00790 [Flavobacteriaceae bacterium]|jgi:hypothetical protein|nr:hypothetical protein [Flavobacteriaceae bacterium]